MRAVHNIFLLFLLLLCIGCIVSVPLAARQRRQIDLTVSAEHEEDETELALEAIAGLWQSADSRTKIDGSARVVHRDSGNGGAQQDWRLGVRVVFS
ncbi:uncharacterized protein LOC115632237 [Scaptodrosophila lebanonensis]|uniref:Uncharacterized protein LOC115632237 n=1 Tax=Drosophila lebanonensis TaxID=7225 RepID=A0A6J2UCI9_DROLE|nr:uncharacterized protein LOC115632237 [Scaptodrosophila lebanonensis]